MLYRTHLAAGIGLGGAVAGAMHASGAVTHVEDLVVVAGLTTLFAVLPDLDTASVIQRWTYRFLLIVLVWLMATGRAEQAAFLGAVSLLPLVHRHRGWMHAWWAVLVVPGAILLLWDGYWIALGPGGMGHIVPGPGGLEDTLSSLGPEVMKGFAGTLPGDVPFALAMMAGYTLHLLLDFYGPTWLRW